MHFGCIKKMNVFSYLTDEQAAFCKVMGLTNFVEHDANAMNKFISYANQHYVKGIAPKIDELLEDYEGTFDGGALLTPIGNIKELILPTKVGSVERYEDGSIKLMMFKFALLPIAGMQAFQDGRNMECRLVAMLYDRGLVIQGENVGIQERRVDENGKERFCIENFVPVLDFANKCYTEYIRLAKMAHALSHS